MNIVNTLTKYKKVFLILSTLIVVIAIVLLFPKKSKPAEEKISDYIITNENPLQEGLKEWKNPDALDPQWGKDFNKKYPWYSDLPINTDEYIVVWDLDLKQFRIALKIPESSPEEIKNTYIQRAVEDIKELTGVLFERYTYYVLYQD